MWSCSRSQGQPVGDRSRAITSSRSLIAARFFIRTGEGVLEYWSGGVLEYWELTIQRPSLQYSNTPLFHYSPSRSQHYEVIPMHHFHMVELAGFDLGGAKAGDASGKFGAVQIADPHHVPGGKLPVAPRDAGRQQALPAFAQGLLGARVHEQRALGMVEERNPSLAALQAGWTRHEQGAFFLAGHHAGQHALLAPRGNDERDAGPDGDLGGLNLRGHSAHSGGAVGSARRLLQRLVHSLDRGDSAGIGLSEVLQHAIDRASGRGAGANGGWN